MASGTVWYTVKARKIRPEKNPLSKKSNSYSARAKPVEKSIY
jgi:hypothetical protein